MPSGACQNQFHILRRHKSNYIIDGLLSCSNLAEMEILGGWGVTEAAYARVCGSRCPRRLVRFAQWALTGGRCLPASPRRPLVTPLARFRVRMFVCEFALRVCDSVWYCVIVLSCLQVVPACVCFQRGRSGRTTLWGPS